MELELVLIRAHDGQKAGLAISDDDLASCEVISVAKGSPAESCGLRPHDRIIAIDGLECTAVQPATSLWRTGAARLERRLRVRRFAPASTPHKTESTVELELTLIRSHDGQKAGLSISDEVESEVINLHKGTPAEASGLRLHDRIIAVDGVECTAARPAAALWLESASRLNRRLRVRRSVAVPGRPNTPGSRAAAEAAANDGTSAEQVETVELKSPREGKGKGKEDAWRRARTLVKVTHSRGWHPSRELVRDCFSDKCLERNPMWTVMGVPGLEGFEKPFQVKLADVEEAREQAKLEACTRVRVDAKHDPEALSFLGVDTFRVISPFGRPITALDPFPFFRSEIRADGHSGGSGGRSGGGKVRRDAGDEPAKRPHPREFGCSIAVSLYLRFNLEFALLMVVVFLVSVPHIQDNISRNELRNQCRAALTYDFDALVHGGPSTATDVTNGTHPAWYSECGYRDIPLRKRIPTLPGDFSVHLYGSSKPGGSDDMSYLYSLGLHVLDVILNGPLTWGLGACAEYSNRTNYKYPVPFLTGEALGNSVFEDLWASGSAFCAGNAAATAFWCDTLVVLLVLLFLVYLRWRVRQIAIKEDKSMWTTGDYAVLLRGLKNGLDRSVPPSERMTAPELRLRLFDDLARLGFPQSSIKQIEVGRKCGKELRLMKQLERANIQRHELAARSELREAKRRGKGGVPAAKAATSKAEAGGPTTSTAEAGGPTTSTAEAGAVAAAGSKALQEQAMMMRKAASTVGVRKRSEDEKAADEAKELAADHGELNEKLARIMRELETLYREPDLATGHAFIVFNFERDKLRLLKELRKSAADSSPRRGLLGRLFGWLFGGSSKRVVPVEDDRRRGRSGPPLPASLEAGARVEALAAPEPSEVNWQALELNDAHEAQMSLRGWGVLSFLLLICTGLIVFIKYEYQKYDSTDGILYYGLMVLGSTATAITNFLLKLLVEWLTSLEGQDTQTEYEASLFKKLSLAYVLNSAAIPMIVGLLFSSIAEGKPMSQDWYEVSGVVGQQWLLLIISVTVKEFPKILPLHVLLVRKLTKAKSHAKLRMLYRPPRMYIGELYANTLKICALALITGPLYPICYLWAGAGLVFCNVCTAFGISRWYGKPPAVDEQMMMALRTVLSLLVLCQICISAFAAQSLGFFPGTPLETYGANLAVYVASPVLFVLYVVTPLGRLHKSFRFTGDGDESLTGDTDGVHFDDVPRLKGYEMEPYICPR